MKQHPPISIGEVIAKLTVVSREPDAQSRHKKWLCLCECGNTSVVYGIQLRSGKTKSCGCLRSERNIELKTIHGLSHKWQFNALINIRSRCTDPENKQYKDYGGRGITYDPRWDLEPLAFYNDIETLGPKPPKMTLDRINNDVGYFIENMRWATATMQNRNKRNNHCIFFGGITQTIAEWSEQTGIAQRTIFARLVNYGWSAERTLSTPVE